MFLKSTVIYGQLGVIVIYKNEFVGICFPKGIKTEAKTLTTAQMKKKTLIVDTKNLILNHS